MMNSQRLLSVLLLIAGASAQFRPWYAGSGLQYPRPFNQGGDAGEDLGDRAGFDSAAPVATNTDAFGHDTKLVSDAAKLPRDSQPFWSLNRDHILRHIGLNPNNQHVPEGRVTQPFVPETNSDNTGSMQPAVTTVDASTNFA